MLAAALVVVLVAAVVGVTLAVSSGHGARTSADSTSTAFQVAPTSVPNAAGSPTTAPSSTSTTLPSPLAPTLSYIYGAVDTDSSVNGRTYQLLAVSQTKNCASVAAAPIAKVLAAQGCLSVLLGLYVDEQADIVIGQDVVVLGDDAQADVVSQAVNAYRAALPLESLSVPLAEIRVYPDTQKDATAQLPAAPASLGSAGPAKYGGPDEVPSGALFGSVTEGNMITYNATAYVDGRKPSASDPRLQGAATDVRVLVGGNAAALTLTP